MVSLSILAWSQDRLDRSFVLAKSHRGWPMEFQEPEEGNEMARDFVRGLDFLGREELEKQPGP